MTITQAARGARKETVTRTDISMRMGAVGARGALMEAGESGGLDLALRADAFLVRTESAKAANTVETKADASRLRLVLEGGRSFAVGEGATLTPTLELGLRHDGGDAETGTGVEVGGRIAYADPSSGLTVEAGARMLVAHEDSGYEEWGASGAVRLDPGASGRGLSFNVLLDRVLGATLYGFSVGEDEAAADAALERLAEALADDGRRPYVIRSAPGHPPLGGLGYAAAAGEVTEQARALGIGFDAVVCASGTVAAVVGVIARAADQDVVLVRRFTQVCHRCLLALTGIR